MVAATGFVASMNGPGFSATPGPVDKVILISLDTVRADHLGCYGHSRPTSPVLDALAAAGTRFAACTTTAPWTAPAHVSMLTGLYPTRSGVVDARTELKPGVVPIAELLRARGFRTGAVYANDFVLPCKECGKGFESKEYFDWKAKPGAPGPSILDRSAEVTAAATRWLESNGGHKFFLFVHYYDAHSDYAPAPEFARLVGADPANLAPGSHVYLVPRQLDGNVPPDALTQATRLYDGEIRQLDASLGTLFAALTKQGIWDQTLVIVTADHGEEFLEHGGLLHGRTMYQELLHVPLIAHGPGIPRGRVVQHLVSLTDIVPTILAATGSPPLAASDGRSLLPLMAEKTAEWREQVASEADHRKSKQMLREGRFKLIVDRSGALELYDLVADPHEHTNLATERSELTAKLKGTVGDFFRSTAPPAVRPLSADERARLKALGYIE